MRETRVLTDGIYFGECPRWYEGRLWFSDFFANAVKSISMAGDLRTEFELDDSPSGLGWMPDGSMLVVSMSERQVLRRFQDGSVKVHAELPHAGFKANDMVVDREGVAYVGDFGFDLHGEIAARGIEAVLADHRTASIARVTPDGAVRLVAEQMHFPNGTVITPDGRTLIVGETLAGALTAFDIEADGMLSNRRLWASTWPRVPDGIALNVDGAVWVSNALGPECVLIAEGGAVIEVIETGLPCFACMLGGVDGRTLFMMTAPTSVPPDPGAAPMGRLLMVKVDAGRAGWP